MTKRSPVIRLAACVATLIVIATTVGRSEPPTRNFLWKVAGRQNSIYLAGSVHLLTKDFYPLNPALEAAFKDSDLLVEEADLGEMLAQGSQVQMLTRGLLPANQSLDQVVSPATFAQVTKHAGDIGLPMEPLKRFKPWALALLIEGEQWMKAGFNEEFGLDKHFYDRAQADGKAVQGLETIEYQISLFDGMPMEQQDRMLADTLKGLDTEIANVNKVVEAWRIGDAQSVEKIVLADLKQDPAMYQRLLVARNQNWLPKLEALFTRSGRAFVVVGAAHLVGPEGLLAILKSKGYTVDQL